jgi:hypothetical protein
VTLYDKATGSRRRALLSPPVCRCVQHRHPERQTGVEGSLSDRKSGIKNPNNCRVFNRFHFSNRKYPAIFHHESATHSPLITRHCPSNQDTAIKTPDKPRLFSRFQFSNRDKMRVLHPEISECASSPASLPFPFSLSESPCLRAKSWLPITRHSSLITHFASVPNLCDNGWLKLRLM